MSKRLRIHRYLPRTLAEGPGVRACIWVQGCSLQCKGCAVPFTWPREGGTEIEAAELAHRIVATHGLEGVTFVGGEPFEQAAPLAEVGAIVRQHGLTVLTFTGFRLEEIRARRNADCDALLAVTDLLIDGPFVESLPETVRPWVGSRNQRFHFLTDRYADLAGKLTTIPNRLEIHVKPNGTVLVNGMASAEVLNAFGRA